MTYKPYDYAHKTVMTAKLPAANVMNGRYPEKKELISEMRVVAYRKGKFETPVTVKVFMGRSSSASVVYCSIGTHDGNRSFNGHGRAGGYGYCKKSAALADAIRNAGIELSQSISGVGESAMRRAIEAIARALGFRKFIVLD